MAAPLLLDAGLPGGVAKYGITKSKSDTMSRACFLMDGSGLFMWF